VDILGKKKQTGHRNLFFPFRITAGMTKLEKTLSKIGATNACLGTVDNQETQQLTYPCTSNIMYQWDNIFAESSSLGISICELLCNWTDAVLLARLQITLLLLYIFVSYDD
jgi:hypothetical protein